MFVSVWGGTASIQTKDTGLNLYGCQLVCHGSGLSSAALVCVLVGCCSIFYTGFVGTRISSRICSTERGCTQCHRRDQAHRQGVPNVTHNLCDVAAPVTDRPVLNKALEAIGATILALHIQNQQHAEHTYCAGLCLRGRILETARPECVGLVNNMQNPIVKHYLPWLAADTHTVEAYASEAVYLRRRVQNSLDFSTTCRTPLSSITCCGWLKRTLAPRPSTGV